MIVPSLVLPPEVQRLCARTNNVMILAGCDFRTLMVGVDVKVTPFPPFTLGQEHCAHGRKEDDMNVALKCATACPRRDPSL